MERRSYLKEKNPFYGKRHSEEAKVKMRARKLGKPLTEEHRKKISIAHKGIPIPQKYKPGSSHVNWKGGLNNYWHRKAREVMAVKMGRDLIDKEVVHHQDRNPKNNNPENLRLINSHSEHVKLHWKEQKELGEKGRMKEVNPTQALKSVEDLF